MSELASRPVNYSIGSVQCLSGHLLTFKSLPPAAASSPPS